MPGDLTKKVSAGARAKLIAFAKTQDAKRNATIKQVVSSRAHEISASLLPLNESRLAALKKVAGISAFEKALIREVEALRKGITNAGRDAKKRRQAIFDGYPRVRICSGMKQRRLPRQLRRRSGSGTR